MLLKRKFKMDRLKKKKQGERGPDKKPRKPRELKMIVRVQLSLTPENAQYLRMYPNSNSNFVNELLENHRLKIRY